VRLFIAATLTCRGGLVPGCGYPRNSITPNNLKEDNMEKWVCTICGYVYDPAKGDPDNGVAAGTKWADVPDDWECPVCGAAKGDFEQEA
jgi:rubredoxin